MGAWDRILHGGELASFGGFGVITAAVLILATWALMPRTDRKKLRLPIALLALNLVAVALRTVLSEDSAAQKPLHVIAVFFLLSCIGRTGFLLTVDWLLGTRLKQPLSKIFRDIIQVLVFVAVALLTLRSMGLEPGSLLTTSALLTAVIGLSLQETLGNLFAGLAIQAQRPFSVGDWIQFENDASLVGRVTEINWRATKVLTNDMVEVVVPNGILAKAPIRNYTQPTRVSRRIVTVQGPYEAPPRQVSKTILEAARGVDGVLSVPPPEVEVLSFGDSGIDYRLLFFIERFERRFKVESEVRARIWYALKRADISIPFPVRDVRVTDMKDVATSEGPPEEALDALSRVDFLAAVPKELMRELASRVRVNTYVPGETVIYQGDEGSELFIVLSGELEVLVEQAPREPESVARLSAGSLFGEMSLMTGERRSATVRAVSECDLLVVGHTAFRRILSASPDLAEQISEVLLKRQAELIDRAAAAAAAEAPTSARRQQLLSRIRDFFAL